MVDPVSLTVACVAGATVVGAIIIEACRKRSTKINKNNNEHSADTGDFSTEGFSLIIKKTGPNGEIDEFSMTAAKISATFQEHDTNTSGISAQSIATGHDTNPLAGAGQQQARAGLPTRAAQANGDQNAAQLPSPDVPLQIPATATDLSILQNANPNASQYKIGEASLEFADGTKLIIENSSFVIVPQEQARRGAHEVRGPRDTEWVGTGSTLLGNALLGLFGMISDTVSKMKPNPAEHAPLQSVRTTRSETHHAKDRRDEPEHYNEPGETDLLIAKDMALAGGNAAHSTDA
jgi:hypothetical protein